MPPFETKKFVSFTEIWETLILTTVKHSVLRNTTYLKIIQQCIQKTDVVQFPLHIGPRKQSPIKSLLPVFLSLLWLVSSTFFLEVVYQFFLDFFATLLFSRCL